MITMDVFTIVLVKESTWEPTHYFNKSTGEWEKDFHRGCEITSENEAQNVLNSIDIYGAQLMKGKVTMGGENE